MPVYMIVESKVKDVAKYQQYIAQVAAIVARHGGRYLARGGKVTTLMGGWMPERMIVLEFPSEQHIRQWLASPAYQAIVPLREAGAEVRAILLEGYTHEQQG